MERLIFCALAGFLAGSASCSKPRPAATETSPAPELIQQQAAAVIDACALLTREEIQAVQGEPTNEAKTNTKSNGALLISECYFALPTSSNSISLQVVQRGKEGAARGPKQTWQEMFHRERPPPASEDVRKKEPAQPIEGVGEEAFWTGNQSLGAFYVLKGDCYLRISVGGAGDVPNKVQKSTALAGMILKRLK